jgi:CRISPR-associated exonuclease Cas4
MEAAPRGQHRAPRRRLPRVRLPASDRVQIEILFSIATTDDRPERWEDGQLLPGSLFLVGDPKQAIYRFRGADIEAYELSRRLISAQDSGAIIEVTANFRSESVILQHVNSCF